MFYKIQTKDGKIYTVSPENISGRYTWNGVETVSFSHGNIVDEGKIIESYDSGKYGYLPTAMWPGNKTTGVNKGILAAAGLGLAALLWLV